MNKVQVKLIDREYAFDFYTVADQAALARKLSKHYTTLPAMYIEQEAEDAAEELFDLTNNPSRNEERHETYGNGRSISVGDIVCVNGQDYLCMSCGWEAM